MPIPPIPPQDPGNHHGERRRAIGLAVGLLAAYAGAGVLVTLPAAPATAATSFWSNFLGMELRDQDGRRIEASRFAGRIVLVNVVYTGCSTTCPVQTRALAELRRQLPAALRRDVHQLSVSIDPLQDTPAALKAYAKGMGADLDGWTFATGRPRDVERLSESLHLYRPGADARKPEDHATSLWLVDSQGQLRMRYAGNPPDVPRLLREITALDALMQKT